MKDGIGHGLTRTVGDQDPVGPGGNGSGIRGVAYDQGVEKPGATGVGQELAAEPDQTPGGGFRIPAAPRPEPWLIILTIFPRRALSFSLTTPT